jgi:hypothetical protein
MEPADESEDLSGLTGCALAFNPGIIGVYLWVLLPNAWLRHVWVICIINLVFAPLILGLIGSLRDVFRARLTEESLTFITFAIISGVLGLPAIFGLDYYTIALHNAHAFSPHIDKFGAIYYAWGTLTTVGSDIGARSAWARSITIVQMVFGLAVFGVIVTVLIARVAGRLNARPTTE